MKKVIALAAVLTFGWAGNGTAAPLDCPAAPPAKSTVPSQPDPSPSPTPSPTPVASPEVVIDWCAKPANAPIHITAGDPIVIRVIGFNFLHYKLKLDISEKTIESYALLEGLWSQLFGLGRLLDGTSQATAADPVHPFDIKLRLWLAHLELARGVAKNADEFHRTEPGLNQTASGALVALGALAGEKRSDMESARADTHRELMAAMTTERWLVFRQVDEVHAVLATILRHVESSGRLARDGYRQALGTRKPGTLITLTAIATEASTGSAAGQKGPYRVFVDSRLPLHFHAGLTYTNRAQVSFEKIRTLAGSEVFQEISGAKQTTGLTAFLTLEPWRWKSGAFGPTLGTDVAAPGKQVFVGASLRISRFSMTVGGTSKVEETGVNPVAKEIAGRVGATKLYETFSRTRAWGSFAAISFSVFP